VRPKELYAHAFFVVVEIIKEDRRSRSYSYLDRVYVKSYQLMLCVSNSDFQKSFSASESCLPWADVLVRAMAVLVWPTTQATMGRCPLPACVRLMSFSGL